MYKVKAVLRSVDKNQLEDMDEHIAVLQSKSRQHVDISQNALQPILNGIINKNVLAVEYFAMHSQVNTARKVEPVGVFFLSGCWHLIAYCRLRNDYRDFRIDRIKKMQTTDEYFDQQHPTLKQYLAKVASDQQLHTVVISVDKEIVKYINEQKYYSGFVSEEVLEDTVEMTFLTYTIEGFARWYMMFGDQARIIGPEYLKDRIRLILDNMVKNIGSADLLLT
jgi:predicted DNA-binding transcriptional regulator YafY